MSSHGEYIYLTEDSEGGFYTEELVVRGHVSPEEFKVAMKELSEDYDEEIPEFSEPWHAYAFWGFGPTDGWRSFNITDQRGRGRFPVTVAEPVSNVRDREQSAANKELMRQHLESKYPEIEIIEISGQPDHWEHKAYARFRFPGGANCVRASMGSGVDHISASICQVDLDAWTNYADITGGEK